MNRWQDTPGHAHLRAALFYELDWRVLLHLSAENIGSWEQKVGAITSR